MKAAFPAILIIVFCLFGCHPEELLIDPNDKTIYITGQIDESPRYDADCDGQSDVYLCSNQAMLSFVYSSIKYPEEARKNDIEGIVRVWFIIEKDGSIGDIGLIQGIGYGCEEEVMRVVRLFPPWIPGKHNGKFVRAQFALPVAFRI